MTVNCKHCGEDTIFSDHNCTNCGIVCVDCYYDYIICENCANDYCAQCCDEVAIDCIICRGVNCIFCNTISVDECLECISSRCKHSKYRHKRV